jgi:hypothetical protein
MKTLAGPDGRTALYALAATTGDVVLAFEMSPEEARAAAEAGAARAGAPPAAVVLLKNGAAFLSAASRLMKRAGAR